MAADGYIEIVDTPTGQVQIKVARSESRTDSEGKLWVGVLSCRECPGKPFKDLIYIVDTDLKTLKRRVLKLLKDVFYIDL